IRFGLLFRSHLRAERFGCQRYPDLAGIAGAIRGLRAGFLDKHPAASLHGDSGDSPFAWHSHSMPGAPASRPDNPVTKFGQNSDRAYIIERKTLVGFGPLPSTRQTGSHDWR